MKESKLNYGYVRVSTDEQGAKGYSIIDQINEIKEFALRNNIHVEEFFKDEGYSATTLNRPAIQKLLKLVAEGKVSNIIIRHSDRLIRNLLLQRSLQRVFEMFEVKVISLNHDTDCSTPEKAFQTDFSGLLNEFEVKKVSPRTLKGLRGSASSGNYSVGGKPPIGYKREFNKKMEKGSYLVIKEKEAEIVIKIFNTLASNRVSVADITKYLNKNKVLNKSWSERQMFRLLDNPIYYGKFSQSWYEQEGHTTPLISKELWFEVQEVIHRKRRETKNFYLFKRLVYCKDCNCFAVQESSYKARRTGSVAYLYYKCPKCSKRKNEKDIKSAFINSFSFHKSNVIDKYFVESLKTKIKLKKKRVAMLNKDFDNNLMEEEYYSSELQKTYKEIKALDKEIVSFSSYAFTNFELLSKMQQRALILSNVEKIFVSFKNDEIIVKYRELSK